MEVEVQQKKTDGKELQQVTSGQCFQDFVQSKMATSTRRGLSTQGALNLRDSTIRILNHCNPHSAATSRETTHLVVGYVQSGKTMSFTGVLAMARDNNYRVAIVLTGVTTNLLGQTADRLEKDLDLREDVYRFHFIPNPSSTDTQLIIQGLRLSEKPLLVIPILKHRKYIDNVTALFSNDAIKKALGHETALIIDDEADQASLNSFGLKNSKKENEAELDKQSAIYAAILRMRSQLPGNSYIQYTATPQANLLISTMDLLSPKSHTLLTPGEDYVGGKKFFGLDKDKQLYNCGLIVPIPKNEVFHKKKNVLTHMPSSLREAMMMHVWAVVLVIKWYHRGDIKQLSMMVHPTDIIEGNKTFEKWVKDEIAEWSDSFDKSPSHEDRQTLMAAFKALMPKALQFYPEEGRPTFKDVEKYIPDVVNSCRIYRLTGESEDDSNNIKWDAHKMNIMIGAQMLNRGFTVEKLATTYMPRHTTGIANADTIEQRCRFFGYKMDYIESCRVYLPEESIRDYKDYVRHEEELRGKLGQCSSLKEYEHCVMMTPHLRPTRLNVLPKQMVKTKLVDWNKYELISSINMVKENNEIVSEFVSKHLSAAGDFQLPNYDSKNYAEGSYRKHSMVEMKLGKFIEFFTDYKTGDFSDMMTKAMSLRYFQYLQTVEDYNVKVIFMSRDILRGRTVTLQKGTVWHVELFQGRNTQDETEFYCGDTNLYDKKDITVQIHHLKLKGIPLAEYDSNETYAIAIHLPDRLQAVYNTTLSKKLIDDL